jgi:hypothetical protein
MAVKLVPGYFVLEGNQQVTITYWFADVDEGPRVAIPYPYYQGGIWATTAQGVNWEGGPPYWKHFVTVHNWTSQNRSFRLRSGTLA